MKAWCIWCETGGSQSPSGMYWIHPECAEKLMDVSGDIRAIKELLKGEHPRNKEEESKIESIYKFIKRMEDFDRRWSNTMKIVKELRGG